MACDKKITKNISKSVKGVPRILHTLFMDTVTLTVYVIHVLVVQCRL